MDGGTWWATVHGVTKSQIRLSDFTQDSVSHSLMPTLCNYSLLSSSVNGILQARILAAAAAKSLQSCPTLCDPIDGSPPGSAIPGILQSESHSVMSDSLGTHGLYSSWNSPGQNTGVGSLSLLQHIFPTQGSNPGLPYCKQILYQLSHKGSLRLRLGEYRRG